MSTLRLVIAWLLMAALPLQGMAAAAMLFCGPVHAGATQPAGHDHASHGHGAEHDTASHAHGRTDGADEPSSQALQPALDAQATASVVDDGHGCPVCAACCNLVALSEPPALRLGENAHLLQPLPGPARVLTRHAPTPDKPPRA